MKKILICDDEPHIVEGLRYLLKGPSRVIEIASNGQEALSVARNDRPDLLIIDLMMPVLGGLETIAMLREQQAFKKMPIIILTAKGCEQDNAAAEQLWGATVVAKPFRPGPLRALVSHLLEGVPLPATSSI